MKYTETDDYAILQTDNLQEIHDFQPEVGWEEKAQPSGNGESLIIPYTDSFFKYGSYGVSSLEKLLMGKAGEDIMKSVKREQMKVANTNRATTRRRRRRKDEFDGVIDIDAFLGGDPQYYRKVQQVKKQTEGVSILINITQPGVVKADKIAEITLNAMNKAYGVSMMGYAVEIKALMCAFKSLENSNKHLVWEHVLKPHNRPFDKQKLYSSVYPALMRVFGFRAYGILGYKAGETVKGTFGYPVTSGVWDRVSGMSSDTIKNIPGINQEAYYYDLEVTEGKQVKNL